MVCCHFYFVQCSNFFARWLIDVQEKENMRLIDNVALNLSVYNCIDPNEVSLAKLRVVGAFVRVVKCMVGIVRFAQLEWYEWSVFLNDFNMDLIDLKLISTHFVVFALFQVLCQPFRCTFRPRVMRNCCALPAPLPCQLMTNWLLLL